jgi:hypothetical protein
MRKTIKAKKVLGRLSIIVGLMLLVSGCQANPRVAFTPPTSCQELVKKPDASQQELLVNGSPQTVEIVNTPGSIQQGLSGRSSIASDGMLFVMPKPDLYSFWMKDMQFNLDLIWIANCQVVAITSDVPKPEPGMPLETLPTYLPPVPVDMVLEVPSDVSGKHTWQVGDVLSVSAQL